MWKRMNGRIQQVYFLPIIHIGIWSIRKLVGEFGLIVKESLLGGKEGNNSTRQSNFGTPKALNYVEEDHFKDESPQQLKSKSASKPPLNSNV